jgi:hypothetical protein
MTSRRRSRHASQTKHRRHPDSHKFLLNRAAVYESIPPGERALAHAKAAGLLEADGADAERLALHLLHSEPAGDAHVTDLLRNAATSAVGRGAPGMAADYLRRACAMPSTSSASPQELNCRPS